MKVVYTYIICTLWKFVTPPQLITPYRKDARERERAYIGKIWVNATLTHRSKHDYLKANYSTLVSSESVISHWLRQLILDVFLSVNFFFNI